MQPETRAPDPTPAAAHEFVSWDASRWQLYTSLPGAEQAAARINLAVNSGIASFYRAIADGVAPNDAFGTLRTRVFKAMGAEAAFGARDTEPLDCLEDLIDRWVPEALRELGSPRPSPAFDLRVGTPI